MKDLSGWPRCIIEQAIQPDDSPLAYVEMIADNLASTLATSIPEGFGVIQKTLKLSSSKMTRDITFLALLK